MVRLFILHSYQSHLPAPSLLVLNLIGRYAYGCRDDIFAITLVKHLPDLSRVVLSHIPTTVSHYVVDTVQIRVFFDVVIQQSRVNI